MSVVENWSGSMKDKLIESSIKLHGNKIKLNMITLLFQLQGCVGVQVEVIPELQEEGL